MSFKIRSFLIRLLAGRDISVVLNCKIHRRSKNPDVLIGIYESGWIVCNNTVLGDKYLGDATIRKETHKP